MSMQIFRKSDFAKMAGVSPPAISKAIRTGHVIETDGKIDITIRKNAIYLSLSQNKRTHGELNDSGEVKPDKKPPRKRIKRAPRQQNNVQIIQDEPQDWLNPNEMTKEEADVRRVNAMTANLRLKYAKDLKILILRETVNGVFQNIYSVAVNYFLTLSDRLSPIIASMCKVSDQKIVIEIKDLIEEEVNRALDELKRQTELNL